MENSHIKKSACSQGQDAPLEQRQPFWLQISCNSTQHQPRRGHDGEREKQEYCLLKLHNDDHTFVLDGHAQPEFDDWAWVSYWYPVGQVWAPKREAYRGALKELAPALKRCLSGDQQRA